MTNDKLKAFENNDKRNLPSLIAWGKNAVVTRNNVRIANRLLFMVLHDIKFPTPEMRRIMRDSYRANIVDMILYAKENKLNPYGYIKSIRLVLLKDHRVRKH